MKKKALPLALLFLFTTIGVVMAVVRENWWYCPMFAGIGTMAMVTTILSRRYPSLSQIIRLIYLSSFGIFLFAGLSLRLNLNFQFPQVIFDGAAGIASGALFQLLIARFIVPFFFGNGFCSRACWDAVVFEWFDLGCKSPRAGAGKERSAWLAWGYLIALVVLAAFVSRINNPAHDGTARYYWLIGENIWILAFGLCFTALLGRRAYCRLLCPFLTLSGLIAPFSVFKVAPVNPADCSTCSQCNLVCPMNVDIMSAVQERRRIRNPQCIQCERCVDVCPQKCLQITAGNPFK